MIIRVDQSGTVAAFNDIVRDVLAREQVKGLLILACDENNFTPADLDGLLRVVPVPVFGGIFPQIIHAKENLSRGTIVAGLPVEPNVQVIPHLSDTMVEYEEILDQKIPDAGEFKTMVVLVDGLSKRISALIDSLFNVFGLELNYIGGGAGSLSFEQKPCLFTSEGLVMDGAVLAMLDVKSGVGVSHGWISVEGPFLVTQADQNVIRTLDWLPAFEVYRQVVEKASGKVFTHDNFFEIAKGYPFGINKLDVEQIVRDPIMLGEDGAMICVGEVPEGSYVDILSGSVSSLVGAAKNALARAKHVYAGESGTQTVCFFDCISRVLYLEQAFGQELDAVYRRDLPMIGALTLGEIANSGRDYLEFYNKTSVIGVLNA